MNSPQIDMTPEGRSQAIAGINIKLGGAVLCAIGSYALWPDSIEWWGLGVHSILLGMASVLSVMGAFRDMKKLRRVEQTLAAYRALGTGPKGARMADRGAMRAAGMQDAVTKKPGGLARLRARIGGAS
jgi:hypothetical protein